MNARRAILYMLLCLVQAMPPAQAQSADTKPYDDRLMRLGEIVGALHYLRELCGAGEGQYWRERMQEIIAAEGTTALRKARLTRSFNQGYRSYSRTYNVCSPSAELAIKRFVIEGADISDRLLAANP